MPKNTNPSFLTLNKFVPPLFCIVNPVVVDELPEPLNIVLPITETLPLTVNALEPVIVVPILKLPDR